MEIFGEDFMPDWSATYTAEKINQEIGDFEFKGTGWYLTNNDTILILPTNRPKENWWHQAYTEDEHFRVFVWNNTEVGQVFNLIINAPTRQDDRS